MLPVPNLELLPDGKPVMKQWVKDGVAEKTRWATDSDVGSAVLDLVQRSLTVDTIMTPRAHLATCRRDETASAVMDRNEDHFSFLPVVGRHRAQALSGPL